MAGGFASPGLTRRSGVSLPIKPAKGYSITYKVPAGTDGPRIAVVDDAMHAAVVPLGNRIRAVGTAEFVGESYSLDPARLDNLARLLARLYPEIASVLNPETAVPWTNLRPMSADGRPFVGESKVPGLWINAGHGHLGWRMAAGSARMLVDLMLTGTSAIDPAPYSIGRA